MYISILDASTRHGTAIRHSTNSFRRFLILKPPPQKKQIKRIASPRMGSPASFPKSVKNQIAGGGPSIRKTFRPFLFPSNSCCCCYRYGFVTFPIVDLAAAIAEEKRRSGSPVTRTKLSDSPGIMRFLFPALAATVPDILVIFTSDSAFSKGQE